MKVKTSKLTETTQGFCDIIDITAKVTAQVRDAEIEDGLVALFVTGSTASLTTIEYEPGLVQDLKELVERLIPSDRRYHHDHRWGDDNGFSHLRASLFGPSLQILIAQAVWFSACGNKSFFLISIIGHERERSSSSS
jgi:secondary thiamine-phosphate synthase enzyme